MKTTSKISALRRCRNRLAFTMVESLLMVSMLGMSAAVVGQSLSTMATSATNNNNILQINDALMAQMEYLRSNYTNLTVPYSASSSVTLSNGQTYTMSSTIADANPGTGPQANFLQIQVTIGGQSMSTFVSE